MVATEVHSLRVDGFIAMLFSGRPEVEASVAVITVYSRIKEDHEKHLRMVLGLLKEKKLYAKFLKCEFWLSSVAFLGHAVSKDGIMVDPKKIEAVRGWARSTSVTEIQSFIGLASYFSHFVKGFSYIASHVTRLTQNNIAFQ
ncbi:uncharacterized mitochondrial protein AtMg00860-like [Lycium ferocissimum]|uniref:uncharacterized mitochondrial protein AtMg00860-like n=1 Tax=Lycium ferocissimum TaxID=112874 RepID=UPI002815A7A0|nr:uncharacterized mitochondrial protein AtMg00860-like [Lycium ferocissimum]